ncbi:phage tail sheath subtilisin-like domain-containing protein [Mycobacterium sp. DL99]|uniref:phage tail sheath subtilisin-like domain-containing protein n=1 Tax=Mycobacterium sp. DL99 TaxID=2528957 RepID=UPI0010802EFD|nr:phage tail sheath subtilisin-like domain-containing protein [Mycobacterium sp. DL99]
MTTGLQLGGPGVYIRAQQPDTTPEVVRLDATGFVGLAPRGPGHTPVRVTSWSEYVRWFGGLPDPERGDTPTQLAYAVDAFFGQGGQVAWVLRVVPSQPDPATAIFECPSAGAGRQIAAANEGSWGNHLDITLTFAAGAAVPMTVWPDNADAAMLLQPVVDNAVPLYSLVRIRHPKLAPAGELRWLVATADALTASGRSARYVVDRELPLPAGELVDIEIVTGTLTITDNGPDGPRAEAFTELGLHPGHAQFIPVALQDDSALASADGLIDAVSPTDGLLRSLHFTLVTRGWDRWEQITADSFYDDVPPARQDPADDDTDHRGVDRMGRVPDIGLLCVPDLSWVWRGQPDQLVVAGKPDTGGEFVRCCRTGTADLNLTAVQQPAAQLDPNDPADFEAIVTRQQRVVEVAGLRKRFVALLDVPFGMKTSDIAKWRWAFDSSYAACYHPWLAMAAATSGGSPVFVGSSAFAAGITAKRELLSGVQRGPANELASDAVNVSSAMTDTAAADLFRMSVNVFRPERDGFRLTSARTLSFDPEYRQLNVRRLMTVLALTLRRVGENLVFEPGTLALRTAVQQAVVSMLRDFFRRGAFAGATEAESFFVRCDDSVNDERTRALGQLITEVGVAPAAPLEFIVVRLIQGVDGTSVVSVGG